MFSVIIPIHNKLPHLDRSIHSILSQSYKDFELILIDDASTDGSSEKLKEYEDPRIRIFKRNASGPGGYAARNLGIKKAKYEWVSFLDADDEWDQNYLLEIYKAIQNHPDTELISANWVVQKHNTVTDKSIRHAELYKFFSLSDYLNDTRYIWTGVLTVKKALIERDLGMGFPDKDTACKRGGDIDTWIRWLYKSKKSIHINRMLARYYMDIEGQVTEIPNVHFCAYKTLVNIINKTKNPQLIKTIKHFSNRFIYNMLARQIRAGMPIDYGQIKKMYPSSYAILRVLKLHWLKVRN